MVIADTGYNIQSSLFLYMRVFGAISHVANSHFFLLYLINEKIKLKNVKMMKKIKLKLEQK